MKPLGGSELLYNNLIKYVGTDWISRINLILSFTDERLIDPNRINVLWQHLYTDQGAAQGMINPNFTDRIDSYVYVSNWQLNQFRNDFYVDRHRNFVIKNAIEPIEFVEKSRDKIRLIYTSMPDRGLEVLLDAWKILNRSDVELVVYSSNIIYGKNYSASRHSQHEQLFHRCANTPGVIYKGYAMNRAIRKAVQEAHILAYPSIYPETSCLAAIEAGAAGCRIVTTDYGALPETCLGWATHVKHDEDRSLLAERYAAQLDREITDYWSNYYSLRDQSNWFNNNYSWLTRAEEWKVFFNSL